MLGLVRIEKQNLNCLYDIPELVYRFDQPYFISDIGKDLLETITLLYEENIDVNIDNLITYGNVKNQSINEEHLISLRQETYDVSEFDFYFKQLKSEFAKYRIKEELLQETLVETSKKNDLNIGKLHDLINSMQENLDLIEGKESSLTSLETLSVRYRGTLVQRKRGEYKYRTGDSVLDKYLAVGFAPGQITTIFGATGIGKSMFALNLVNKQINKGIPCMYMSLEMDETSTVDRLISLRQEIPSKMFEPNFQDDFDDMIFERVEEELNILLNKKRNFFLVTDPSITMTQLEQLIKEAKKRMKVPYLCCTIDLVSMLSGMGTSPQDIEEAMNHLHIIAKRQNVHLVTVVQANRQQDEKRVSSIDNLDDLRPKTLHGIKNAGAYAERSRIVLSVFRQKYYAQQLFPEDPETEIMPDIFKVTLIKQSQGKAGGILKYLYDPDCFKLYPYIEPEEE